MLSCRTTGHSLRQKGKQWKAIIVEKIRWIQSLQAYFLFMQKINVGFFKKMDHSWLLFLYFRLSSTVDSKLKPMTGF